MFDGLIELVFRLWRAGTELRDSSRVGESDMDRTSRRIVAWVCGGLIALLAVGGLLWWWLVDMSGD